MTTEYTRIRSEISGAVARLTLNRPEKRNALDGQTITELRAACAAAASDETVRVVVLTGAGKDFCAGADLAGLDAMGQASSLDHLADAENFMDLFLQIRRLPKPVVARVTGRALAGGCGLASACDLIVAAESAQFGYPEVKIGFIPAMVMAVLRRNISEKQAFEWMAFGDPISATEAKSIGFANQVFPDAEFDEKADAYITTLASRSASALYLMKRLLYHMDGLGFDAAIRSGADANVLTRGTADCKAGIAKFLGK